MLKKTNNIACIAHLVLSVSNILAPGCEENHVSNTYGSNAITQT